MLKAKVSLWTTVLIILIIASGIISWIKTNDLSAIGGKEITVSIDSKYSADITNNIADKKIGSYKVKIGNNNPSVIIKDTSDTVMEGYEKHANAVYSPIVLYVRNEAYDHQNGFVTISTKGGISALKVDLRKILDAMLNEKTWGDIGINEKVAKGTVNLVIPNERSPYWNEIESLFYITMNNDKEPTAEEREALKDTVNKLLNKCEKVYDIEETLIAEVDKPSSNYKVFIGPEYLFSTMSYDEMSYSNTDAYMPAYFYKTTNIYMDVFEKEVGNDGYAVNFVDSLQGTRKWYEHSGFRVVGVTEYYSNTKSGTVDFVP
jgi:hypothetical protein